ncbi:alpha/beta fold hydrolase [Chitinophaga nivalis]|uniref:Alpha/beta hydrolase n=1 Tax=Chitinophaga nivalis TaxID=2991709 RepID=A0ABT3IMQ5_9BACT|nr:alpha/beta hydrolase [Chitinophaga nivalis]MCW3465243.1 alpha/beta hydrolase [Chitinophaga nivalis]MCW3485065.1 alpha/beta hydrolase [Chitinophaga nivalis]
MTNTSTFPTAVTSARFKSIRLGNVDIFYREAGDPSRPAILLLHGFPASSYMYRNLINDLAANYYVVAPDYPGFGHSSSPAPDQFTYTFDYLAGLMEQFMDAIGLQQVSLYMQDYGGPIGFRIASKRPQQIQALLVQNANAYLEGLAPQVQQARQLMEAGDLTAIRSLVQHMLSFDDIKSQYLLEAAHPEKISPDAWTMDHYFLSRPGYLEIQTILFANYYTNFKQYDSWHAYFRQYQPPALIIWGKNDRIFLTPGAEAFLRDLPNASLHILDAGHFLLEEEHGTVATLIHDFLTQQLP